MTDCISSASTNWCHACNLLTWLQVVELNVQVPKCRIFLAVTKCDRLEDPPKFSSPAGGSAPAQLAPGKSCRCQPSLALRHRIVCLCSDPYTHIVRSCRQRFPVI